MSTKKLVTVGLMLAIALVFQIGFSQFAQTLVGPLVNMTLIITVVVTGIPGGAMVGIFTPIAAFALGIVPFLPIIPFVIIGNVIYVTAFGLVRDKFKTIWAGYDAVVVAAVLKFGFLALAIRWLVPLLTPKVPPALVQTFTLPQLVTALIGGALALIIMKFLPIKRQEA